jgi:hypothetical protein
MNILERANEITFQRNEEKERMYGPFEVGMEQTARIASELCRKEITAFDAYNVLIALKLSRASWNYKEDNYLDAISYMASLDKYIKNKNENENSVQESSKGEKPEQRNK